jgi:hypothetical protein
VLGVRGLFILGPTFCGLLISEDGNSAVKM